MSKTQTSVNQFFKPLKDIPDDVALPEKFTFPFYYEPHPLSLMAAHELQHHLETQTEWEHNFGLTQDKPYLLIGKMFGVLVVQTKDGNLGYLSAFSGKLADSNHLPGFVPPVFDTMAEDGFLTAGMAEIDAISKQLATLQQAPELASAHLHLDQETALHRATLDLHKAELKTSKLDRKARREAAKLNLTADQYAALEQDLIRESHAVRFNFKRLSQEWDSRLAQVQSDLDVYLHAITKLKEKRRQLSAVLQDRLHTEYQFLNQYGHIKNLFDIFEQTVPSGGAGECAAPKLLQFAFQHDLKPIAMAEFWWGQSPKSEIRKHGMFYPACRGKCLPILRHMLEGIEMDDNPMMANTAMYKTIEFLYEDDAITIINKPPEMLSVPGKNVFDSVFHRMKQRYPDSTSPLIVHRLDMSTSGIMLIAKTEESYKTLQRQFIKRIIKKRYVALLDGVIAVDSGHIDLPLRVDLDDRPRQLVCYEHGKPAQTNWEVISRSETQTKVAFYPITGRTHQLRVHAAHPLGLDTAIAGDDIYGVKGNRLHLHAETLTFFHPTTGVEMSFQVDEEF